MNRDDLNQLLNVLIPFAQQTLGHQGGFLPFAAVLKMRPGLVRRYGNGA